MSIKFLREFVMPVLSDLYPYPGLPDTGGEWLCGSIKTFHIAVMSSKR